MSLKKSKEKENNKEKKEKDSTFRNNVVNLLILKLSKLNLSFRKIEHIFSEEILDLIKRLDFFDKRTSLSKKMIESYSEIEKNLVFYLEKYNHFSLSIDESPNMNNLPHVVITLNSKGDIFFLVQNFSEKAAKLKITWNS